MSFSNRFRGLLFISSLFAAASLANAQTTDTTRTMPYDVAANANAPTKAERFEMDRQAILAMTGDYAVTFDFTETVPFVESYELKPHKVSHTHEIVRVLKDTGTFISLQHILVGGSGDNTVIVKHWRQDWSYQPEKVLIFTGGNAWGWRTVDPEDRKEAWSQTVYQVDDAPRYGGEGVWEHKQNASAWTPGSEWRPLPRRDATTRDDYDAIDAVNRHTITSRGWVHEQDNTKLVLRDGEPQLLVREVGVNTYVRADDFNVALAEAYWAKTADYWAGVRTIWDELEQNNSTFALTVQGEPHDVYAPILELARSVEAGEMDTKAAIKEARVVIKRLTTTKPEPLLSRLALHGGQ